MIEPGIVKHPSDDLVRRLAKENETTAGFIAACYAELDNVVSCLRARGWKESSVQSFREQIIATHQMNED